MACLMSIPLAEWPQWQTSNFTSTVENELLSFPNNAHLAHTLTVLLLNMLAIALSAQAVALPLPHENHGRELVRGCIIKMGYAHIKESVGWTGAVFGTISLAIKLQRKYGGKPSTPFEMNLPRYLRTGSRTLRKPTTSPSKMRSSRIATTGI